MLDKTEAQANGALFGQTIAEHVLGLGSQTREQVNAKYLDVYRQIAGGTLTLVDSDAEFSKGLPVLSEASRKKLSSMRQELRNTQVEIAKCILDAIETTK